MLTNYGYIYKTTNLANKYTYIGQKKGNFNPYYFGSGLLIRRAIKKYDKNNFQIEIIAWAKNKKQLDMLEKHYITLFKNHSYNISEGGTGGKIWGEIHPMKGKHLSQERKNRLRLLNLGKKQSLETILKKRIAFSGENNPMFGKHHSQETKNKIGKANSKYKGIKSWNYGKPKSEETKNKSSKTKKRNFALGITKAWNKGTKGICKPNSTSFKKGNIPWIKGKKLFFTNRDKNGKFIKKQIK